MRPFLAAAAAALVGLGSVADNAAQAQSIIDERPAAQAPDPGIPLYFAAASLTPSDPADPRQGFSIRRAPGGRFEALNAPLRNLILFAYQIENFQLVDAPAWITDSRYDILANLENDPPPVLPSAGADHMMLAMRTLLAERFQLRVHRATRSLETFRLVTAAPDGRPGPALRPASGDCAPEALANRAGVARSRAAPPLVCGVQGAPGRIRFGGAPLTLFASGLAGQVGRPVIDQTGLSGNWDFELTFAPPPPPNGVLPPGVQPPPVDPDAPDLLTALRTQLGLTLERTVAPVDVLVVDRVQEPEPD